MRAIPFRTTWAVATAGLLLLTAAVGVSGGQATSEPVAAANDTPAPQTLALLESVELPIPMPSGFAGGMRCDGRGDVFARFARINPQNYTGMNSPAAELVLDSKRLTEFAVNPLPQADYPEQFWQYFDLDANGAVYALIHGSRADEKHRAISREFVVRFRDDGTPDSILPLEPPAGAGRLFVYQLAAFPGGNFLVAGSSSTGRGKNQPFTAIYDSNGRMVRRVGLPEDVTLKDYLKAPGPKEPESSSASSGPRKSAPAVAGPERGRSHGEADYSGAGIAAGNLEMTLSTSSLVAGPDGYAYLLRNTAPAKLYVVDSTGQVMKYFQVESPDPGDAPFSVGIAGPNQLFFDFENKPPTAPGVPIKFQRLVGIFSTLSGGFEALYRLPESAKRMLVPACADQRGSFLYLGSTADHQHLAVYRYGP